MIKHGMRYTPEYAAWRSMKSRCLDAGSKDFHKYGGRNISIFPQWIDSFEIFYKYLGPRPKGKSLDRIDNNGGYFPGNVRWATRQEQQRNRSNSFTWHIKGHVFQSIDEAASYFEVSIHCVWRWVNGQFDRRRNRFSKSREDCHVTARY